MINHIKYAISRYSFWLSLFAIVIGIIAVAPLCKCVAIFLVVVCFVMPFFIPLLTSCFIQKFRIKTIGKSKISFVFGNLFNEDYIVITTNRYYDINPTGEYISEDSILGKFVQNFCSNDIVEIEKSLKAQLSRDEGNHLIPAQYGEYIKKKIGNKTVYFLVFTDRNKSDQPKDFYIKTVQGFLNKIADENHGKTISIPLLGGNNNLSDSGFSDNVMAFKSLMTMINNFEIVNQRSELKLKIVALPRERSELISVVSSYIK